MAASSDYARTLERLAKPFLELGIYDSPEKFARVLVSEMAESKIRHYASVVRKFESKYKMPFHKFSEKLKRKATPKREDDWMEWEAAINMLKAWKRAREELGLSAS